MQNQFVITIDSKVTPDFALSFLENVNFIKSIPAKTISLGSGMAS